MESEFFDYLEESKWASHKDHRIIRQTKKELLEDICRCDNMPYIAYLNDDIYKKSNQESKKQ